MDEEKTCAWEGIYDEFASRTLNSNQYNSGLLTLFFGMWLSCTIVTSRLFFEGSYRNLGSYTLAATLRRATPGLLNGLPFFSALYSWEKFPTFACNFFGFWETFFAVFEIESLTMVCIERYVQAKYVTKGWQVPPSHYYLYGSLCVFFAFCYAYPPIIGIGQYAPDFDCYHCTFDIILPPQGWKRYLVLLIFFMRSIKPSIMMLLMLYWARNLEVKIRRYSRQRKLTKGTAAAAASYILCGLPITVIRGWVILSQLIYGDVVKFSEYAISTAMIIHWSSPAVAMFALFYIDPHLRRQLFDFADNAEPDFSEEPADANDDSDHEKMD